MESVIYHLLSVICLLREETDRAVQKANTLEAAAIDEISYLSSDICYLSAAGRRQTGLCRRQTPWRRQPVTKSLICHLISVICLLQGGDREGCTEGIHLGGSSQRCNLLSVI